MLNRLPKTALPLLGFFLLVGLYWLYWSELADRLRAGVTEWAQEQAADGIIVTWTDLRVRGFPTRVRLEFDDLVFRAEAAETPWSWSTPEFHAHVLPYSLDHVIASARSPMLLTRGPGETPEAWEITAENAQASYVMKDGEPPRVAADLEATSATRLDAPGTVSAARAQLHARKTEDMAGAVDLAIRLADVNIGDGVADGLTAVLGHDVSAAALQSRVTAAAGDDVFDDLALFEFSGGEIQVSEGRIAWGDASATFAGRLAFAPSGTADGRLDTRLQGQEAIVNGLIAAKLIDEDLQGPLKAAIQVLQFTNGDGAGGIKMPVIVKDSDVYLGPVRVGRMDSPF